MNEALSSFIHIDVTDVDIIKNNYANKFHSIT